MSRFKIDDADFKALFGLDGVSVNGPVTFTPETDPTGRSPKDSGAKLDMGKPRPSLVILGFSKALMEVAKVGTYGAEKYTDGGWVDVPDGEARYTDAMLRHLLAESEGSHDEGSGLLHAAHAAWCALCRLEFQLRRLL